MWIFLNFDDFGFSLSFLFLIVKNHEKAMKCKRLLHLHAWNESKETLKLWQRINDHLNHGFSCELVKFLDWNEESWSGLAAISMFFCFLSFRLNQTEISKKNFGIFRRGFSFNPLEFASAFIGVIKSTSLLQIE
jgi:hypothetical protein